MRGRSYRRAPTETKPKPWYERDGGERLAQDRERIAAVFPGLSYRIDEQARRVFLEGAITLEADCGIGTPIQKDTDGIRHFLEGVAVFLDQQLTYEAVGKGQWPGRQRSHGDAGYVEFVLELLGGDQRLLAALAATLANRSGVQRNSPCPCGSGIKYKRCHLRAVEEISRRVGLVRLYAIFGRWCKNAAMDMK
jgi:SEC-C motif